MEEQDEAQGVNESALKGRTAGGARQDHAAATTCGVSPHPVAAGLPARTVAVLDNYQDVRSDAALHEVLRDAFSQIPEGMNLIILSRHEPPPVYAADRANGVMVVLGEEQLRLTEQESSGICKVHRKRTDQDLGQTSRQLHERAHGWAAGLVLMMEHGQGSQRRGTAPPDAPQHVLFDYFCREVFAKADLETQQLLLSTAFLPMVSPAAAEELSGSSRAGEILSRLHRGNFFTSMRAAPGKVYEYHPLLRDFLTAQVEQLLAQAERTRLARRSAEVLQSEGRRGCCPASANTGRLAAAHGAHQAACAGIARAR